MARAGIRARQWWCALTVGVGAIAASTAWAQIERAEHPAPVRPSASGRVVRVFDFEERGTNPLPVPAGWYRGQSDPSIPRERAGFPVWNGAELDYVGGACRGEGAVRLPTEGGSTSLILQNGIVPVFAGADYRVSAMVRTEGLTHAKGRLVARLLDQQGRLIDGGMVESEPVRPGSGWRQVSVDVLGDDPDAAFIQIELLLLQPKELSVGRAPRAFDIWPQDFSGAVWFDDVMIVQLPRVEVSTTTPGNVVTRPDRPELMALVRDLVGLKLDVEMRVHDIDGRLLDSKTTSLAGGRLHESWTPAVDRLGWYRASIILRSGGRVVERAHCDFIWLGEPTDTGGRLASALDADLSRANQAWRERFTLRLLDAPDAVLEALPQIARSVGVGSITLPVWSGADAPDEHRGEAERLAPAINLMLGDWRRLTLAFDRVPDELTRTVGVDLENTAGVFAGDRGLWGAYVDPYLDRFGQRVHRWQVGRAGDQGVVEDLPVGAGIDRVGQELARLVPGPVVVQPWRTDWAMSPQIVRTDRSVVAELTPGTGADGIGIFVEQFKQLSGSGPGGEAGLHPPELVLSLPAGDDEASGATPARARVSSLAKKVIALWRSSQGERVGAQLSGPWETAGRRRQQLMPTPELAVWRQLVDRLGPRRISGELDLAPGVRSYLLEPSPGSGVRTGSIVAWREDANEPDTPIVAYLGDGEITVYDLFGNTSVPASITIGEQQAAMQRVALSDEPVFIEGVDVELVRFLDGARLEPGLIVARNKTHRHALVFDNPWAFPIRGRVFLLEPGGYSDPDTPIDRSWTIEPRIADFAIPAGESGVVPLDISFSAGKIAGRMPLVFDIELSAGRDYGMVRVEKAVELGLPDVTLDLFYTTVAEQGDAGGGSRTVVVRAEVSNKSDGALDVELIAVAPGHPRAKVFIYRLNPGETAIRMFPFYAGYDDLRGRQIAVGLIEAEHDGRLNKAILIE